MDYLTKEFTSSVTGVNMLARVIRPGERGGRWLANENRFAVENKNHELLVSFYDKDSPNQSPLKAQMISTYYLGSLKESDFEKGLCLDGGNSKSWTVGGEELKDVVDWAIGIEQEMGLNSKPLELGGYHP